VNYVALLIQQFPEIADKAERVRVPVAERLAAHLQRLAHFQL
jgi:hypothetical protein